MEDNSEVEQSVGVYSRFHLAANEGTVIKRDTLNTRKTIIQNWHFQLEVVYELQPHNPRDTEIYRLDYSTKITNRHSLPTKRYSRIVSLILINGIARGCSYSKEEALCAIAIAQRSRRSSTEAADSIYDARRASSSQGKNSLRARGDVP